eukprot:2779484-Alexandrium_andersonii.AAC.1
MTQNDLPECSGDRIRAHAGSRPRRHHHCRRHQVSRGGLRLGPRRRLGALSSVVIDCFGGS